MTKTATTWRRGRVSTAVLLALALTTAACRDDQSKVDSTGTTLKKATGPSLKISSPADGSAATGNTVPLQLVAENFTVVKADGDTSGKTGHFHVFIDTPPVAAGEAIPKSAKVLHSADPKVLVSGLHAGEHTIVAVLGDGTHKRVGTAQAKIAVTVKGPGIDASLGATPPAAGQPASLTFNVTGVEVKKADGDTSGKSGHAHIFIDRDPTPPGQAIPAGDPNIIHSAVSPVALPALAAGDHVVWVVVGDGAHMPFSPAVMHKLTVTVA